MSDRPARVRIIAASANAALADRLAAELHARGFEIVSGEGARGLNDAVVVVWSGAAISSKGLIEAALGPLRDNILVPVSIGRIEPPAPFRGLPAIDLAGWSGERSDPKMSPTAIRLSDEDIAAIEAEVNAEVRANEAVQPRRRLADALLRSLALDVDVLDPPEQRIDLLEAVAAPRVEAERLLQLSAARETQRRTQRRDPAPVPLPHTVTPWCSWTRGFPKTPVGWGFSADGGDALSLRPRKS